MSDTFAVPDDSTEITYFEFTVAGTKGKHKLPHMDYITAGQADMLSSGQVLKAIFDMGADEATVTALRGLRRGQLRALVEAWNDASSVSPGESSAS